MQRTIAPLLYILLAVGTLAGLFGILKRYQVEQHNRRVEIALEYSEVRQLAQMANQPLEEVLAKFKTAGVTSLSVTENTLAGLEAQGEIRPQQFYGTSVTVSDPETLQRIKHALEAKGLIIRDGRDETADTLFEADNLDEEEAPDNERPPSFAIRADYQTLRPLGIGLDPEAVEVTKKAGLQPVGRINNWPRVTPQSMTTVLGDLKTLGVKTVIFQGLEVLGFRGQEKAAAAAIKQAGLYYGQVEFGKQKGDEKLGIALKGEYVRVHSISDGEMGTMDETEAIDRFVRAARERNIRLCYIRLITSQISDKGDDPVTANVKYLQKISKGIERDQRKEMEFGAAHLYEDTGVSTVIFALIALGVAAGLTLLLLRLAPVSDRMAWATLAVSVLACLGLIFALGESGRKLVALLAALVFPTLACLRRDVLSGDTTPSSRSEVLRRNAAALAAVKGIFFASAVTTLGIIAVVGLLASRSFIIKANQFLGIKAAHAVPVLIIGLAAITGLPRLDRSLGAEWARLKARVNGFLSEPTRVGQLLVALVALLAFALIVARTGNEPGVGVSGIELKFRSLLDRLLPVRPRTKEFLIGHPAFILALAFWFRGRRRLALPLFVVGVIGQVSILNTFCHTHTPLHLSLIRDITGLVFGTVIGLILFWLLERFLPQEKTEGAIEPRPAPDTGLGSGTLSRPATADALE